MSSITQCNYCSLKDIKRQAARDKLKIIKIPSTFAQGWEIFTVPKDITPADVRMWKQPCIELPDGDEKWQAFHQAWFMEISDHCCC